MATNKGRKPARQVSKADLAKLKKAGLYSGDLRKAPTKYAQKLAAQYRDVISGRAKVITVGRLPSGRNKGVAASKAKAKELAAEYTKTLRAKGNKLVVRVARPDENVYYSKARDTIVTSYRDQEHRLIEHEYVRNRLSPEDLQEEAESEGVSEQEYLRDTLPDLRDGQSYALPLSRGSEGIDYQFRPTKQEMLDLALQYEQATKRRKDGTIVANPYEDAIAHIQIVTIDAEKHRKRRKKKPQAQKKKSRVAKSNVVPFKRPPKK